MKGGIFEAGMQLPALPSLISDWAWVESKRVLGYLIHLCSSNIRN